jgi:dipeptidyl aminopeptidase/acylaminoacyl peptidase
MLSKIALSVGLALAFGSGAAVAQQKPVPVESFVKQDQFSSPRLSPDGKHIAIKVRMMRNGRMIPTLTVYSLPDLKIVSTMAMDKFEIPLGFTWATNTRLLVTKGIEVGLREIPWSTGEVIAVDLDGKRFQYLYGHNNFRASTKGERYGDDYGHGSIESIPAARNGHALIGTYLWGGNSSTLYDMDTVSAIRKLVAQIPAKGLDFYAQRDGTPRFATGYSDEARWVVYRRDDANGEWKKLPGETIGKGFWPAGFTQDDSEFYAWVSTKGEPYALVRESLKTGQRTVLAQDANSELSLQWHDQARGPFAAITNIGVPTVRYIDPDSANAKLHKTLSQQFPGAIVHFINFTDDGSKLLFSVSSDRDPGSYYLYDRKAGSADLLFSSAEEIDPEQMSERRPFTFKARDGLELFGYLTMPKNAHAGQQKLPMVLMPHGGPFGIDDSWFFDNDAQFLASRGYAVLQVNFRGSGGRGEAFKESGHLQWGGKIQEDLIDGVKAAIKQGGIDAKRICTFGGSFGGYSALMLPIREPDMFKCAVGYAGVYDLAYIYKQPHIVETRSSTVFYKRTMGENEAELARQSPAMQAEKIKVPVWLIHGGKDETALPEHAKRMREALIKAGNPPEWTMEPDEGHGFYDPQRRKELYEKLEAFLGKHIGKAN